MPLTKAEVTRLRSLQDKKHREDAGLFVIEGGKVVGEEEGVAALGVDVGMAGGPRRRFQSCQGYGPYPPVGDHLKRLARSGPPGDFGVLCNASVQFFVAVLPSAPALTLL